MLGYLELKDRYEIKRVNCDLLILDGNELVTASILGDSETVKKFFNKIKLGAELFLKDREDDAFERKIISIGTESYNTKGKQLENFYHGIIFSNTKYESCLINWKFEELKEILVPFLREKKQIPITEPIVSKLLEFDKQYLKEDSCIQSLDIFTSQESLVNLKGYRIIEDRVKERINFLEIPVDCIDSFNWDEIQTIGDYLLAFIEPIQEKIKGNIDFFYHTGEVLPEIAYKGLKKPFKGQIPIIGAAKNILKKDKFVYISGEQGTGKTFMSLKALECYFFETQKKNAVSFILCPTTTIKEWEKEIKKVVSCPDNINVFMIKETVDFIKLYQSTLFNFDRPTYILCGKETFKLQYDIEPIYDKKKKKVSYEVGNGKRKFDFRTIQSELSVLFCRDCGKPLIEKHDLKGDVFLTEKDFKKKNKKTSLCVHCNAPIWTAIYKNKKKTSVIDFIKTKKIKFDMIVVDEMQEHNNGQTLIGNATKTLLRNHCKKTILLSGTPNNGYASSLYNAIVALMPRTLIREGIFSLKDFVKKYGTLELSRKGEVFNLNEVKDSDFEEVEGINPIVFTKYLLRNFVSAELMDIAEELPPLNEYYIGIDTEDELICAEKEIVNAFENMSDRINTIPILRHYVNNPFGWNNLDLKNKSFVPRSFPVDILLNKEKMMLDIIEKELLENRKVMIYIEFNDKGSSYMDGYTIPQRIKKLLEDKGIGVFYLDRNTCKSYERKEVLEKAAENYSVFMCNRSLVSVGLNLQFCPTYINYIPSFMINTVEQANRRGWRADSVLENRVYNLYLKEVYEQSVMEKYQRKKAESNAIVGKFNVALETEALRTASKLSKSLVG